MTLLTSTPPGWPLPPSGAPHALASLAFVAALLLALPGVAIALYLYIVDQVASSGGWLLGFFELLFSGFVILPVVLLCCVLLLAAGLFPALRPWACIALLAVNVAVLAVGWTLARPTDLGGLTIWTPAFLSMLIAAAIAWTSFQW